VLCLLLLFFPTLVVVRLPLVALSLLRYAASFLTLVP
jgi:hypothetical protein